MTKKRTAMEEDEQLAVAGRTVEDLGWMLGTEAGDMALALLASAVVGPNVRRITEFTGLPSDLVAEVGRRARKHGIWSGGRLDVEWADPEAGAIAFCTDALVIEGLLERVVA